MVRVQRFLPCCIHAMRGPTPEGDLSGFDLTDVDLSSTELVGVSFRGAVLRGAILGSSLVTVCDLGEVDLRGADLSYTVLRDTCLAEANFSGACCAGTAFANCDLSSTNGLDTVDLRVISDVVGDEESEKSNDEEFEQIAQGKEENGVYEDYGCTIGIDTLIRTIENSRGRLKPDVQAFFLRSGIPASVLQALAAGFR